MPEGDTLFRAARRLHQALAGQTICRFATRYAHLAAVDDQTPLCGRQVLTVAARGKHLLISLSGDLTLHTHMLMSGSWHLYRPGEPWQRPRASARIELGTATIEAIAFDVPVAALLTTAELSRHPQLSKLGPDLLADATYDQTEAVGRLRALGRREIGEALLHQSSVAGIGNVFKSEVLFVSGVNPFQPTDQLDNATLQRVLDTARKLLRRNVLPDAAGSIVTYTGLRRTTSSDDPSARLWVYGRGGKPCRRCGNPIAYRKQGRDARGTYWCPVCQLS